jgi:hypothetical protein
LLIWQEKYWQCQNYKWKIKNAESSSTVTIPKITYLTAKKANKKKLSDFGSAA